MVLSVISLCFIFKISLVKVEKYFYFYDETWKKIPSLKCNVYCTTLKKFHL